LTIPFNIILLSPIKSAQKCSPTSENISTNHYSSLLTLALPQDPYFRGTGGISVKFYGYGRIPLDHGNVLTAVQKAVTNGHQHDVQREPIGSDNFQRDSEDVHLLFHAGEGMTWGMWGRVMVKALQSFGVRFSKVTFFFDVEFGT